MTPHDEEWQRSASVADWPGLLQRASTEEEIVEVTRDYLATWSPEEIAMLPPDCRPGRIKDGEDISQWAYQLAVTHCSSELDVSRESLLVKMLAFITQSAVRVSEVTTAKLESA